ncbi:MAG: hypothetical protein KKB51_15150 [Candidatus Riflebacteria bacterium]|nr:hypothetical protein [Candidatus Riflebacteria bacterium]
MTIKEKKGFAIALVLVLSSILLLTSITLFRTGREYNAHVKNDFSELQAYYMAVSAIQHTQLKVKYFPTELYDASEFSLGKNPMFDFSILSNDEYDSLSPMVKSEYSSVSPHFRKASPNNSGPRFLSAGTMSTDNNEKWFQLNSLDSADANLVDSSWFSDGWPKDKKFQPIKNSDLYLWKYARDIANLKDIQPALSCDAGKVSANPNSLDVSSSNELPYEATYQIVDIRVISTTDQKRLNEEVVSFTGVGSIKVPVTGEIITYEINKKIKVRRK